MIKNIYIYIRLILSGIDELGEKQVIFSIQTKIAECVWRTIG